MGFGSWITKRMPGGYASQARDYLDYFRKKTSSKPYLHSKDWKEVFEDMVTTKGLGRMMSGNTSNSMVHVLLSENFLEKTQGDLFQFVFYMVYFDNEPLYRESNKEILDVTAEVIYDEVKSRFPAYVKTDINDFKKGLAIYL